MKNAKQYEKKVKKLLSGSLPKRPEVPDDPDVLTVILRGILEAETTPDVADKALQAIRQEFVDYNELRVAPYRDVVECVGKDLPAAWDKSQVIYRSLNQLFGESNSLDMAYLEEKGKRDLRRYFEEAGLPPFANAYAVLHHFKGHAVPVDQALVDCLQMDELVHPESDVADVQGFLERIISQKDDVACHQFFREYVGRHGEQLAELRKERRQKEQAQREKELAELSDKDDTDKKDQAKPATSDDSEDDSTDTDDDKNSSGEKTKTASRKAASKKKSASSRGTKKAARTSGKSAKAKQAGASDGKSSKGSSKSSKKTRAAKTTKSATSKTRSRKKTSK